MRVVVFGAGGVGGYFGARLAASGSEVAFVARGAHLAAMRERGLMVHSPLGDVRVQPVTASDDPAALGAADIVLFCVKLYDTDSAAARLKPLLGPDTAVISLQNGIDSEKRLAAVVGERHVAGGVAYISATIEAPGIVRHHNRMAKLDFGELGGRASPRLQAFLAACEKAGIEAALRPDIERAIWEKFVFLAPFAAVTGVTRLPIGPVLADSDTRALLEAAMREVVAVAASQGVALAPDLVERLLRFAGTLAPDMKASLAHDLERGNRIEIEGLCGALSRLGAAAGVDTPVHRTIYAALKPYAGGRPATTA
jgi:2-dehydropantoate 2-reductase